jgi:tetratricopeptide (TPR) repeat protein
MGVLTGIFSGLGVFIAVYFLLCHDWSKSPTVDFSLLDQIGLRIMAYRPNFTLEDLPPNQAGGILGLLFPFALAFLFDSWKKHNRRLIAIALVCFLVIFVGLIMTSSRGAWLALLVGMVLWLLWRLCERFAGGEVRKAGVIFGIVLLALGIVGFLGAMFYPGGVLGIGNYLPGLPNGRSRLELVQNALHLIGDFPLTGAGLGSFGGLYSQYMMVTPYFLFEYSHNFMLDIALEQSVLGWLSIVCVYGVSVFLLVKFVAGGRRDSELRIVAEASMASLVAIVLHGLVDDALYANTGTPLLFLLPGMAVGLSKFGETSPEKKSIQRTYQKWLVLGGITFVMIGLAVIAWRRPLLGIWHSNLGAVSMAQKELAGWPTNQWDKDPDVSDLESAKDRFLLAVKLDPNNRTAHHRLGLIALQGGQYKEAQDQLGEAYRINSDHRGIQKTLGYANVWAGSYDQAAQLLAKIPEAEYELSEYVVWWKSLRRADLARQAEQMEEILKEMGNPIVNQRENQP